MFGHTERISCDAAGILSADCRSKASKPDCALSVDELLSRAIDDHGALINMSWTKHLTDAKALRICAIALSASIEDWCFEHKISETEILPALRDGALATLLARGWDARERFLQSEMFEDQEIWAGAARHEARRDLG